MTKIGPIALASRSKTVGLLTVLTLLTGLSYAADSEGTASQEQSSKITLTCSGTVTYPAGRQKPVHNRSVLVDMDQGTLSGIEGRFSITRVTEQIVSFKGQNAGGFTVSGVLDRLSGSFKMWISLKDQMMWTYELACKRANPLF